MNVKNDWDEQENTRLITIIAINPHFRFQHYYERYMAHKKSVTLEKQTAVANANDKINELMKSSNLSWTEVS